MKYYLLIACLILTACSNLPREIEDPPAFDLSYVEAVTNLNKYKNAPVRWGGTIVEVENEPSFSAIQILVYPLGSYGRPDLDESSQGRFVVKSAEFLDPAVYTKNTSITVAGILDGDTERKVGNKALRLPLVAAKNIHLWPEQTYNSYYGGYGGFGYGGGLGYYPYGGFYGPYPYYWGGYYRPYYGHRR
ncbi:MAG: Slp family lipoprotein [Methylococcaceae bacterium]|nr:Slp family lipoprotein [Methylococcaceae bacterium]